MKRILFLLVFALIMSLVMLVTSCIPASASALATNYTYTYSIWEEEIPMPDAYYVATTFMGNDFGIGNFNNPRGIFTKDNLIYVCDTGNNRVVIIAHIAASDTYELVHIIDHVYINPADVPTEATDISSNEEEYYDEDYDDVFEIDEADVNPQTGDFDEEKPEDDQLTSETDNVFIPLPEYNEDGLLLSFLRSPNDVFVTPNGDIFISDTDNQRILRLDKDYNYINSITKPVDATVEQNIEFLPEKFVVDFSNRIFVQVRNINKGLMEFTIDGDFTGYMGANRVTVNIFDRFWKAIASAEQRSRMELFVATEYNNVAIDHLGFLFTTLSTFSGSPFDAGPVRRLNAIGNDILVRNGIAEPAGDWFWGNVGGATGPSRFVDVIPFDNDSYACLDRVRGRIFVYDFQGNILYIFGGIGNKEGYFMNAASMDKMGYDIFVIDSRTAVVTRFNLTEYGKYINEAMNYYYQGLYDDSALMWDEVLKLNGNYELAYIGKGRAALRNEQYYDAMTFYKTKYDQENYGKAFAQFRKEWIEERVIAGLIILISLYVLSRVLGFAIRRRKQKKGE